MVSWVDDLQVAYDKLSRERATGIAEYERAADGSAQKQDAVQPTDAIGDQIRNLKRLVVATDRQAEHARRRGEEARLIVIQRNRHGLKRTLRRLQEKRYLTAE